MILFDAPAIVLDIESDGNPLPEPVEIAVADFSAVGCTNLEWWLLNPHRPMNPYAINVHGLRDDDVATAADFGEVADDIERRTMLTWMIGHNIGGDAAILERKIPGLDLAGKIDTAKIAKFILPNLESFKLGRIAELLELPATYEQAPRGLHSAAHDVLLAGDLLMHFAEFYPAELCDYLKRSGIRHVIAENPTFRR